MKNKDILYPLRKVHGTIDAQYKKLRANLFIVLYLSFPVGRKVLIPGTPEHQNLGDSAIVIAEKKFLEKCGISANRIKEISFSEYYQYRNLLRRLIRSNMIIAQLGGGNMGDQWIEEEKLQLIYEAIANSPTSYNGQQYSVIAIDDQALKERLYELIGQKQIKTCALFLIFCADYHKVETLAQQKNIDVPPFRNTMDGIMVGAIDATIAMSNARVMAEALGLGCCCIGYVRTAAPQEVSTLLHLPQGSFIVCGLAIGYPREQPDMKPKQNEPLLIHHNRYHDEDIVPLNRVLNYLQSQGCGIEHEND